MKQLYKILFVAMISCAMSLSSQSQRYLTEVFTDVTVDTSVVYGVNATILYYQFLNQAVPEQLKMDVYHPSGDTVSERPLILYFHTGNFLPTPQNGSPSGTRRDLNVVEMCNRLARMGYVVASCDYRLGWNPVANTQDERVNTLINAAYRGVQDCRTAIRYFRKTEAEENNPFAIDPNRICVWGQGTGGYIAYAAATLDNYLDVLIPKFIAQDSITGNPIPMVIEPVHGNIYGTTFGVNPFTGDTLCYPNHPEYSSSFNVMVNMGGALGDSSWLDATDMPMISYHSPTDPFAPYGIGTVIVPGFNLPVVEVSGSGHVQEMANALGLNNSFTSIEPATDVYSIQANTYNQGHYGLFPLNRPAGQEADSAPWEWWLSDNPNNNNGLVTNPTMSEAKGMAYLDSIQNYAAQRLMCALALPGNPCNLQVLGCTNASACNYNAAADANDGSCLYIGSSCEDGNLGTINDAISNNCECTGDAVVAGCSIPLACNYDPAANVNDGSCLFTGTACDDQDTTTINDVITADCLCLGISVGVSNINLENNRIELFPNPTYDILNINGLSNSISFTSVRCYDLMGKLIFSQSINGKYASLDVSMLESGSYVLVIGNGQNSQRKIFAKN